MIDFERHTALNDKLIARLQGDDTQESLESTSSFKSAPILEIEYEKLPSILQQGCNALKEPQEKAVFLLGGLACLSAVLPNIYGVYDGCRVYPHLYYYLLGNAGAGKGGLRYAKILIGSIHQQMRDKFKSEKKAYDSEFRLYQKQLKLYERGKTQFEPQEPAVPKNTMLIIPANNTAAGVHQILDENDQSGLIFESEGDTLANAFRSEHGQFSDTFRKASHHETVSYYRKTDKEHVEMNSPKLATVLSSTFDQLLTLIPTSENGLFSRFLYYQIERTGVFRNVFDESKDDANAVFLTLAERVHEIFDNLSTESERRFRFTKDQQSKFLELFQSRLDGGGEEMDAVVKRMGLQCFRIAMILTVLRAFDNEHLPDELLCGDEDFQTAISIIDVCGHHAEMIHEILPKKVDYRAGNSDKKQQAIEMHKSGKTLSEIALVLLGNAQLRGTVSKWLKKAK